MPRVYTHEPLDQPKRCLDCGEVKPPEDFGVEKAYGSRSARLRGYCKLCSAARSRQYYADHREERIAYRNEYVRLNEEKVKTCQKTRRDRVKAQVLDAYGGKCICCSEDIFLFLTIDHINNDGAAHRKRVGVAGIYRDIVKQGFPDDLQCHCWNCNMGKALNGGICPHITG